MTEVEDSGEPGLPDLPALWTSAEWRAESETWIHERAAEAGLRVTGPVEQVKLRFWSVVQRVETDGGALWFKENAPSQSFEAAVVEELARLAPGRVPPVVGVDRDRGWLLTADLGEPLGEDPALADDAAAAAAVAELAGTYAEVQRTLETRLRVMFDARVPAFEDGHAMPYAVALADRLAGLPEGDGRRLSAEQRRLVEVGLRRLGDAAAVLEASGIPDSLQHNDLHLWNVFRSRGGQLALIDFGDSVWSHPFASVRILLWMMRARLGFQVGSPEYERVVDAYLEPWSGVASPAELRRVLRAAERISCLHRAESWRRLMDDVPLTAIDEQWLDAPGYWLLAAVADDPYEATRD